MSKKNHKRETSPAPRQSPLPKGALPFMVAGIILVLTAAVLAQKLQLGEKLQLDLSGVREVGSAEALEEENTWNIRYQANDGAIYRKHYKGRLSGNSDAEGAIEISIVYDPDQPSDFQPRGLSYLPGTVSILLFVVGMGCMLSARQRTRRPRRSKQNT